ncbi:hypothetical protein GCM10007094_19180 [Pseudovibrio japonicus]|uniref:Uncharacterized protein n=1 Tax=Pseudovibrio japonicus TaxID=366534 RepID=A0ABQ3ED06_9HYPH|nr:hypothetical protein GCM10007094_19180 [Pseudovibrio japonicus]
MLTLKLECLPAIVFLRAKQLGNDVCVAEGYAIMSLFSADYSKFRADLLTNQKNAVCVPE